MMDAPAWEIAILAAIGVGSLGVWWWLLTNRTPDGEILAYETRLRVPWALGPGLIPIILVTLNLAAMMQPEGPIDASSNSSMSDGDYIELSVSSAFSILLLIGAMALWLVFGMQATKADLGLPNSWRRFAGDVRMGVVVALAAMAPVYGLQILLVTALNWNEQHPTLTQVVGSSDWRVLAAAFLSAVVVAPIVEEFLFRLMLQGGLERIEDQYLKWRPTERHRIVAFSKTKTPEDSELSSPVSTQPSEEEDENPYRTSQAGSAKIIENSHAPELTEADHRTRLSLLHPVGLPHGWPPILISGLLFGLAHASGQGPAPLPLFLFGVLLGYLYQRTHRITPCIVAHMVFNAFSLGTVWFTSGG